MSWLSVILMCLSPFLFYNGDRIFPFRIFNSIFIYKNFNYWLFYALQALSLLPMNLWNTVNDLLVSGLIIQICVQLELVSQRLKILPVTVKIMTANPMISKDQIRRYEHRIIKQNVQHHVSIIK